MNLRATLIGFSAILMWALLALFTKASGTVPPLEMNALCFAIGAIPGLITFVVRPARLKGLRQPAAVWLTGVLGLFGYHFLYFTALRNAPAANTSMIAYLWPLFIVLGSAMLPGERLRLVHIIGALAGFAGAILIVSGRAGGSQLEFTDPQKVLGYLAAFGCAVTWAAYSLINRRFATVPTDAVTGFCLSTAILSLLAHLATEQTIWPLSATEWMAIAGLGLFPVGLAFYAWDYGVKKGNIQSLGVVSYASPVLSTLALLVAGFAEPTWQLLLACILVTAGAMIAVSGSLRQKQPA